MQATAVLLPAWAGLVMDGRAVWGSSVRLKRAFSEVGAHNGTDLTADMRHLAANLAESVPISPTAVPAIVASVAEHSIRRWGDGLAPLSGFRDEDVSELVESGLRAQWRLLVDRTAV